MSQMSYHSMTEPRRHPSRGYCIRTRRFSISRLRVRFVYLYRFLSRWKFSHGQAVKLLKRSINLRRNITRSSSSKDHNGDHHNLTRGMVSSSSAAGGGWCSSRIISYNYARSFYSDAISDCLEYIKMSNISMDHEKSIPVD